MSEARHDVRIGRFTARVPPHQAEATRAAHAELRGHLDAHLRAALVAAGVDPQAEVALRRVVVQVEGDFEQWARSVAVAVARAAQGGVGEEVAVFPDRIEAAFQALLARARTGQAPWWWATLRGVEAAGRLAGTHPGEALVAEWIDQAPEQVAGRLVALVAAEPRVVALFAAGAGERLLARWMERIGARRAELQASAPRVGPAGALETPEVAPNPPASGVEDVAVAAAQSAVPAADAAHPAQQAAASKQDLAALPHPDASPLWPSEWPEAPWFDAVAAEIAASFEAGSPTLRAAPPDLVALLATAQVVERLPGLEPALARVLAARVLALRRAPEAQVSLRRTAPLARPEAPKPLGLALAPTTEAGHPVGLGGLLFFLRRLARDPLLDRAAPGLALHAFARVVLAEVLAPLDPGARGQVELENAPLLSVFTGLRSVEAPSEDMDLQAASEALKRLRPEIPESLEHRPADVLWTLRGLEDPLAACSPGQRALSLLVLRPGRLRRSAGHADLYLSPRQVDLSLRIGGWDLDPGWFPWVGRVIHFHYEDER